MGETQILKTRVTPESKARVVEMAQGELLTEAKSVLACVDRHGNVQRIPDAFQGIL